MGSGWLKDSSASTAAKDWPTSWLKNRTGFSHARWVDQAGGWLMTCRQAHLQGGGRWRRVQACEAREAGAPSLLSQGSDPPAIMVDRYLAERRRNGANAASPDVRPGRAKCQHVLSSPVPAHQCTGTTKAHSRAATLTSNRQRW